MKDQHKILFREYGDQAPGIIPGDVYCQLKLAPHKKFRRDGSHLFYNQEISLVEALTGFEFKMTTLDNRILIVKSEPNVLYAPGSIRAIREEGMPQENNPTCRGNLYIVIKVNFPKTLKERAIKELATFLPDFKRPELKIDGDYEECYFEDFDLEEEKEKWKNETTSRKEHNAQFKDDDEAPQQGHQTQCQTQ
eukprot:TRINITY_DN835_c0_g1_i1.p1 TRINITY_DN835_c0_g1~~TRINITY_DN835_c0_g1_i1.p1  ORF type:complete len:203 (+),score=33.22 TRINITY_DN835_c0_g1_i1:31-609(+)